jgi:L-lactate dehydrogenase complex protein LldE
MKIGLFVPCYVDQLLPRVGMATLAVLERLGLDVEFPEGQTCCGQPMANAGLAREAAPLAERFLRVFAPYDAVVAPSGSCVSMVRNHYEPLVGPSRALDEVRAKTFELCEFLVDVAKITRVQGRFPHRVGLHQSCHGLRELRLASGSERVVEPFGKVQGLLSQLEGITLVELSRPDECCGFGGVFSVGEPAISTMMGRDRIADHEKAGAEVVTGVDASCLLHLEGLARRERRPLRFLHVAEILAEARLS